MKYTVKLDTKRQRISVVQRLHNVKLRTKTQRINFRQTGLRGPQGIRGEKGDKGDKGDTGDTGATGISTFVRVHHGNDANVARPNALYVEWVGNVPPNNATTEDTWINIA